MRNLFLKSTAIAVAFGLAPAANAGFIANFHENDVNGNNSLFVFGQEGTTGTITGNDGFNQNFVLGMDGVFELSLGSSGREMTQNGAVNALSLSVQADNSISGFALNRATFSSDATVLLDTDGLGSEYRVLSTTGTAGDGSQVSVTAVEDNTIVTVESPIALAGNPANTPFQVTLNAGETVFFESGLSGDVSGTHITATQDVAVFAGAECTNVPAAVEFCDHLIAQQFSVDNFGTEFKIAENFGGGSDGDLLRIIASEDGTEIFLDGVSQGIINAGEVLQLDGVGNGTVTASAPVQVGQFVRGQEGSRSTGDPAFAIIPSVDQQLDSYVFAAPTGTDAFVQNFLNIAIDEMIANTLTLDGLLVDTSGFDLINGTLFGNIAINQGIGAISAGGDFLATISGFSTFDSYFSPIATSFSTGASPTPDDPIGVPVPAPLALIGLGLAGLGVARRRRG